MNFAVITCLTCWVVCNGWLSRFKRLLTTGALVFNEQLIQNGTFTARLAPWVHYISIQIDYADLYDVPVFFWADLAGRGAHEELAVSTVREGKEWSLKFWREEDIAACLFRCLRAFGFCFYTFICWSRLTTVIPRV
ncbi:hypothetical protein M405DRAFT_780450 [Rhizopogon salebrosus TDB-379]|nr:hypothetical protein M405DRAFT_780450 [Rhizopogon salebrosus TDB-379]